ncbi:MAG: Nif3-like dinuclear metal center hexameric protein [Bacteroidales bacterium]|nr:Nif3-like dinuclear metal center hexameric protein [Bacteroidales bacterium]
MKIKELINYLESIVPTEWQESWDNSGLQLGDPDNTVDSALICLDITEAVIREAEDKACGLIISHHPLIIKPLSSISRKTATGRIIFKAVNKGISIYSMHTNLDIVKGGVSYHMAEMMKLKNVSVLSPLASRLLKLVVFVPTSHAEKVRDAIFNAGAGFIGDYDRCSYNISGEGTYRAGEGTDPYAGDTGKDHTEREIRIETVMPEYARSKVLKAMIESHPYEEVAYDIYKIENTVPGAGLGCTGDLEHDMKDADFLSMLSDLFGAKGIRHTALKGKKINKVAVMGGSGGSYIREAIHSGADAFVTADIKYHSFFEAGDVLLADIGHYESEKPALEILHELITKKFPKFAVRFSETNTNPVNYLQVWKK